MSGTSKRAAIYARYSSDEQREASIDDQVRVCSKLVAERGWSLIGTYEDRALSGATTLRPNYQRLLEDARSKRFDVVVAEGLDRLSRDQEAIAHLYKNMTFLGIDIVTKSDDQINEMHIGLKGTMNAIFLKDLKAKTHRGLEGRVRKGRSAGGKAYGYDVVRKLSPDGKDDHGHFAINPAQAEVVRRIFSDFDKGKSPRAISRDLNAAGVPGPNGPWRDTTIRGHAQRRTGILRNDLYVGVRIWGKQEFVRDPSTGKRVARRNAKDTWIRNAVPDLRILDQELWDRVQARLDVMAASPQAEKMRSAFRDHRRPQYLFTGLIKCGSCGGNMSITAKTYLACTRARSGAGCTNRKGVRRPDVEAAALNGLRDRLMTPEAAHRFIKGFHAQLNQHRSDAEARVIGAKAELAKIERTFDGIFAQLGEGALKGSPAVNDRIQALETRKVELVKIVQNPPEPAPRFHPALADTYRAEVERLQAALNEPEERMKAAEILRGLVDAIIVKEDREGQFIEVKGEINKLLKLAGGEVPDPFKSSAVVVAGAGFEPTTFRL